MHLRQSEFTYSSCWPFTKKKQRKNKKCFKEEGHSRYIYQSKLDKTCFQYEKAYGEFKNLTRTALDKILHDKAFNIMKHLIFWQSMLWWISKGSCFWWYC